MEYNKIYARTNADGVVTKIFSEAFEQPQPTDTLIDDTNTDRQGANRYAVTDENGYYNYCIVDGKLTERDKTQDIANAYLADLRRRRERECFSVINRGQLWYSTLTPEQMAELDDWYNSWLNVTKTRTIPTPLPWLK